MTKDNYCPIISVENGYVKNRIGSYTKIYKIEYRNIFSLSRKDYKEINELWNQIFKLLPDWTVLHKQDFYVKENYYPERKDDAENDLFAESYFKKFLELQEIILVYHLEQV